MFRNSRFFKQTKEKKIIIIVNYKREIKYEYNYSVFRCFIVLCDILIVTIDEGNQFSDRSV